MRKTENGTEFDGDTSAWDRDSVGAVICLNKEPCRQVLFRHVDGLMNVLLTAAEFYIIFYRLQLHRLAIPRRHYKAGEQVLSLS